ncbi:MAG: zinc ribbon domain-containing protein [Planctomycetota bacterium]|nr:MAG: zinc ribbon domain-containing protein [Planctomycetota bacterium]REJ97824.1 MAG: zinc ribbon domain-containing protein [Planctomycetota bacterium]REK25307.1 MAG: zinc ribbon domain-containing protein [Planctomycetota bacterium]REK31814.1 MAG: zinc ribbon domain-containing protein [Planctomycetota bacterium]
MPLFEFRCEDCREVFEALVRRDEPANCPACNSTKQQRLMSAPARTGHTSGNLLPLAPGCPPADAPPCSPGCCRL